MDVNRKPDTNESGALASSRDSWEGVTLTGFTLTLPDVVRVARSNVPVTFAPEAVARMDRARTITEHAARSGRSVYGFNTGVGVRKLFGVEPQNSAGFSAALLTSHRTGQGPAVSRDVLRAAMLRLANDFASGAVAIRPEVAQRYLHALNSGEVPAVRSLGSTGCGDLAQLADLAAGLDLPELAPGEALALINSDAYATAIAALAIADAGRLLRWFDVAAALDLEAFAANVATLDPAADDLRFSPPHCEAAARMRRILDNSYLLIPESERNLQDPLTFRDAPQVHGAFSEALHFASERLHRALNGTQHNPAVLVKEGRVVPMANDGLPLSAALDFVRLSLAPVVTCACERILKLLDEHQSGLPEGLQPGDTSSQTSLDMFAMTAQALAAEARLLAQPVSFEVVSSTAARGIEDRMNMGPLSATRLNEMLMLAGRLVAVELVVASQAIDLRQRTQGIQLGRVTQRVFEKVRQRVPFADSYLKFPTSFDSLVDDMARDAPDVTEVEAV